MSSEVVSFLGRQHHCSSVWTIAALPSRMQEDGAVPQTGITVVDPFNRGGLVVDAKRAVRLFAPPTRAHLMRIGHQLGVAGYLETVRGRGGGSRLARSPETIRIGDVVRHTKQTMALVDWFDPEARHCRIAPACDLRAALKAALDAFLGTLDGYTLADLVVRRRKSVARLIGTARVAV